MGTIDEMRPEYEGRVRFTVLSAQDPSMQDFDFGADKHGLVTLTRDGRRVGMLPGHRYGRTEIEAEVEKLLEESR